MIAIVVGTKAELIKCMPIMLELQKRKQNYWFIHTGQHSLGKACEEFGIKKPDFVLSKEPGFRKGTKFWSKIRFGTFLWCVKTMFQIRRIIRNLQPKYVLYHGDTMNTAMAAGASSFVLNPFKRWQTVHLEAGLRSGSIFEPIPEEFTRRVVDKFSDMLIAVSDLSENNLRKELRFVRSKRIKLGNTVIDSSLVAYNRAKNRHIRPKYDYALINIHRHENLRSKKRLSKVVEIISNVSIPAYWSLHNNTKYFLEKYGLMNKIKKMKHIKIIPLLDYYKFIFLLANCKYVLADGGSIQEESLVFKKPCILLRKRTERQEGLATGINFLTKLDVNYTNEIVKKILSKDFKIPKFRNPYGKAGVSKEVVNLLR